MYAVLSSGGKQYRVEAGTTLMLERLEGGPGEAGAQVTFDRVLLIGDGDDVTIGTPTVVGASISATVLGEALGPKLVIFKFKQKVKYRRRTGHRQHMTRVRIDAINPSAAKRATAKAKADPGEAPVEASAEAQAKAPVKAEKPAALTARPRAKKAATAAEAGPTEPVAEKPKARRATKPKPKAEE